MDLLEEQETVGSISSDVFSASSEISLSKETDSLVVCPSDDGADAASVKQGNVFQETCQKNPVSIE